MTLMLDFAPVAAATATPTIWAEVATSPVRHLTSTVLHADEAHVDNDDRQPTAGDTREGIDLLSEFAWFADQALEWSEFAAPVAAELWHEE